MNKTWILGLLALPHASHVMSAQEAPAPLVAGTRVRLVVVDSIDPASGERRFSFPTGRVASIGLGALVIQPEYRVAEQLSDADSLRIDVTRIRSADRFTGRKRHGWLGAVVGLTAGGIVGVIASREARHPGACRQIGPDRVCYTSKRIDPPIRAIPLFATAGAVGGGAIGFVIRTERWKRVDIGQLRSQARLLP